MHVLGKACGKGTDLPEAGAFPLKNEGVVGRASLPNRPLGVSLRRYDEFLIAVIISVQPTDPQTLTQGAGAGLDQVAAIGVNPSPQEFQFVL